MWFGLPFTLRRIRDYAVRTISGEPVLAQVIPEPAEVRLFGVRNNGDDRVGVPLHLKIESPVTIYSGLPNIIGLMARSEGWRRFSATGQPVCRKLSARTWERLDSPARRGGLGATSSTMALSSPGGFPTLAFKSGQHFGGTGNGPMDAALLEVVQSFREGPVDNGFRREHNLALISLGFQNVPDPDPDLLAHALRDYNLVFILDGYDGHR
jgi:hypothetical protein